MQVDDRHTLGTSRAVFIPVPRQALEEAGAEDVHEAGQDDQVGLAFVDFARQREVVVLS